jgi:hypothetical protein
LAQSQKTPLALVNSQERNDNERQRFFFNKNIPATKLAAVVFLEKVMEGIVGVFTSN